MTAEENKRMEALAYIIADLKAENIEMTQRVHQLMDDYNEAVRQQHGLEMRKDEDSSKQTLDEMMKMRDHCDELERKNGELEQRVHQLTTDYNDVVRQLNGKEKRKDEDPARLFLGDMQKMRDHCDKLEKENRELKGFVKAIHSFMKDKQIYMEKGANCQYYKDGPHVCSTFCLECKSCLGIIEGLGVICANKLVEARVFFPNND